MLINYMVNAFLKEYNFLRHNFYFVGTMRNVSFQIIVRHKMHFPKIPVNKCMFRSPPPLKNYFIYLSAKTKYFAFKVALFCIELDL